jgi:hypothetical protein
MAKYSLIYFAFNSYEKHHRQQGLQGEASSSPPEIKVISVLDLPSKHYRSLTNVTKEDHSGLVSSGLCPWGVSGYFCTL